MSSFLVGTALTNVSFEGARFNGVQDMTDFLAGTDVTHVDFGGAELTNAGLMSYFFEGCSSLVDVRFDGLTLPNACDMSYFFEGCSSLKSVDFTGSAIAFCPPSDDARYETIMDKFFADCKELSSICFTGLDTSNVETMTDMFESCKSLKKVDLTPLTFENCSVSFYTSTRNVFLEEITVGDSAIGRPLLPVYGDRDGIISGIWFEADGTRLEITGEEVPKAGTYYAISPTLGPAPYDISLADIYINGQHVIDGGVISITTYSGDLDPYEIVVRYKERFDDKGDIVSATVPLSRDARTVERTNADRTTLLRHRFDYDCEVKGDYESGAATIVLTGKGNYTGTKEVSVRVALQSDGNTSGQDKNDTSGLESGTANRPLTSNGSLSNAATGSTQGVGQAVANRGSSNAQSTGVASSGTSAKLVQTGDIFGLRVLSSLFLLVAFVLVAYAWRLARE